MIIRKKTEFLFEIEFDESEVQNFEDIEDIFEVVPEDLIRRSLAESLRLGASGVHNLLDIVTNRRGGKDGPTDTRSD